MVNITFRQYLMDIFNHKDYEKLWYDRWVEKGCFKAEVSSKK